MGADIHARGNTGVESTCVTTSRDSITSCYSEAMTTVEVLYRYGTPPTEQVALALARTRDVYGIRRLTLDHAAHTVRVEFDATRLNPSAVNRLLMAAGLDVVEEVPLVALPAPEPEPAPAA
jgi:hypothetical protein